MGQKGTECRDTGLLHPHKKVGSTENRSPGKQQQWAWWKEFGCCTGTPKVMPVWGPQPFSLQHHNLPTYSSPALLVPDLRFTSFPSLWKNLVWPWRSKHLVSKVFRESKGAVQWTQTQQLPRWQTGRCLHTPIQPMSHYILDKPRLLHPWKNPQVISYILPIFPGKTNKRDQAIISSIAWNESR